MCQYRVTDEQAANAAGRYSTVDVKVEQSKPCPTSPGLSDLWAQHCCHRSSTHSPVGMFIYIQAPHPLSLPLACVSLPLSSSSSLSDLLQCGRQLGGWVNRGGGGEWKKKGVVKEKGGGGNYPFFFSVSLCAHTLGGLHPSLLHYS